MMKQMVVVLALAVCSVTGAKAQMGQAAPKVPAGTIIEPSKSFDALLKIYEDEMMGAVNTMLADKYDFAPSPAIFKAEQGVKYDGVRTFGAMVAHVAQANYFFYGLSWGAKPDVDVNCPAGPLLWFRLACFYPLWAAKFVHLKCRVNALVDLQLEAVMESRFWM